MASSDPSPAASARSRRDAERERRNAEYAANGWVSVDPYSRDYCYQPCHNGLHVCGEHPDGVNCLTVLNLPTATAAEACELFERARSECATADGEDFDLVVDLQQGGDCDRDFSIRRQMLDRLKAIAAEQPRDQQSAGDSSREDHP